MTVLLDSNVLIALAVGDHVQHRPAHRWLARADRRIATCPITQGALLRLLLRHGTSAPQALRMLTAVGTDRRHEFWPDELSYSDVTFAGVIGHRQVTDAYLAALARKRDGRLATFDRGLAQLHPDVCELVPVE